MAATEEYLDREISEELDLPAIPSWVDPTDSAERLERMLRLVHAPEWRHNGLLTGQPDSEQRIDPIVGEKTRENWERTIRAIPTLEWLDRTHQLNPLIADQHPELIDPTDLHEALRKLAEYMLGDNAMVEAVHPHSQVRYRLNAAQFPTKRLAIAFAEATEIREDDKDVISKQAFVFNADETGGRFDCQEIKREIPHASAPARDRFERGINPNFDREEYPVELPDLVSNIRILAECDIIRPETAGS